MTIDELFERFDVNPTLLNAELQSALGSAICGISCGPYGVIVHFVDDPTPEEYDAAQAVIEAHDPKQAPPPAVPESTDKLRKDLSTLEARINALEALAAKG
jgi:hypothetical protein